VTYGTGNCFKFSLPIGSTYLTVMTYNSSSLQTGDAASRSVKTQAIFGTALKKLIILNQINAFIFQTEQTKFHLR
jgi:hypothetical protein